MVAFPEVPTNDMDEPDETNTNGSDAGVDDVLDAEKKRMAISSERYEHLMDLRKQKKKHIHEALDELAVDNAEREEAKKHLLIITITNTK